jgi:urease accessory protein
LLHPLTGVDHLLAAVGMGLWLSLQRYTSLSAPLYFAALLAGVLLAILSKGLIADIEWMLAATLIITGLFLFKACRMPQQLVAAVIAVLFSCHFYAHITAMPVGIVAPAYIGGIFIGTGLLVMVAAAAGSGIARYLPPLCLRIAGALIVAAGVTAFGLA